MPNKLNSDQSGVLDNLKKCGVIAIIRMAKQSDVSNTVECLVAGGVKCLEVASNTPGYLHEISVARERYPNTIIGAGTITSEYLAKEAIKAGAQFLVTPNVNKDVICYANNNIPILVGALTPTEICQAWEYGADIVKLFPAGEMGTQYCEGVLGPLNNIPLMAVGGIDIDNLSKWLSLDILGVGVGSKLCRVITNDEDKPDQIKFVNEFMAIAKNTINGKSKS